MSMQCTVGEELRTSIAIAVLCSSLCRLICLHGVQLTSMAEHPVRSTLQVIVLCMWVCVWGDDEKKPCYHHNSRTVILLSSLYPPSEEGKEGEEELFK